jgi:hypothetical protein
MTTVEPLAEGVPAEEREARLDAGAALLAARVKGRSIVVHERFLLTAAAALMTGGVCAILLGWLGASRSILVSEQVPYLISGGLLGVALAMIGGLVFFAHWLTAMLRENRRQHEELLQAIRELRDGGS